MRQEEAEQLIKDVWHQVTEKGMPINARVGNIDAAEWIKGVLTDNIHIDKPIGVNQGTDFDHCPRCNGIIGQSAFYCKRCGAMIREGGA